MSSLYLLGQALSQLLNVALRLPLMWLGDEAPDPDETFSAVVGRRAMDGAKWAFVLEVVINALFWPIEGWGHVRRAAALHSQGCNKKLDKL